MLKWLTMQNNDKLLMRILPVINEFRNECLLIIEAQERQILALNGFNDCGPKELTPADTPNSITGASTGYFSAIIKFNPIYYEFICPQS